MAKFIDNIINQKEIHSTTILMHKIIFNWPFCFPSSLISVKGVPFVVANLSSLSE